VRDVESAKIDLALKSDFNLKDAFRLFDQGKSLIS
jgi:Ca2+-binding EF-hand superfamily protein